MLALLPPTSHTRTVQSWDALITHGMLLLAACTPCAPPPWCASESPWAYAVPLPESAGAEAAESGRGRRVRRRVVMGPVWPCMRASGEVRLRRSQAHTQPSRPPVYACMRPPSSSSAVVPQCPVSMDATAPPPGAPNPPRLLPLLRTEMALALLAVQQRTSQSRTRSSVEAESSKDPVGPSSSCVSRVVWHGCSCEATLPAVRSTMLMLLSRAPPMAASPALADMRMKALPPQRGGSGMRAQGSSRPSLMSSMRARGPGPPASTTPAVAASPITGAFCWCTSRAVCSMPHRLALL
mmetsp:Transcript_18233/g.51084  ORF Transcript_18233/g.51084 Transcript_18233/m.51084 type:complete len:295 (-) Transcript_18233:313-1197(-)